jgi:hypothetical protein
METARKMVGKYWSHSDASKAKMAARARERWARMSEKKRSALGKKISKAKKGVKPTPAQIEERGAKIRAWWASLTPKEREARIKKATKAGRAAAKKRARPA